jgi:hypothetical protein
LAPLGNSWCETTFMCMHWGQDLWAIFMITMRQDSVKFFQLLSYNWIVLIW